MDSWRLAKSVCPNPRRERQVGRYVYELQDLSECLDEFEYNETRVPWPWLVLQLMAAAHFRPRKVVEPVQTLGTV